MDPASYYTTTLSNAFQKLGPIVLYVGLAYFLFIKLPFMFAFRVAKANKLKKEEEDMTPDHRANRFPSEKLQQSTIESEEFRKKKEIEREEERLRQERKRAERERIKAEEEERRKRKEEAKREEARKEEARRSPPPVSPAAEMFQFRAGETITKSELKKRYHKLIRQIHPDKVETLDSEIKEFAERKTKEINAAYQELLKKAS